MEYTKFRVIPKNKKPVYVEDLVQIREILSRTELQDSEISILFNGEIVAYLNDIALQKIEIGLYGSETKKQAAERLGIGDKTFDYALPQPWVDVVAKLVKPHGYTYDDIIGGLVWLYDEKARMTGRPFPLTKRSERMLGILGQSMLFG